MLQNQVHIHPTAALAERVLLPGDPGRAMRLAQALLDEPKMFNHHRGLWGYTGIAQDGHPLTIQSTGIGGPSAAIVISELVGLGARQLLRVGTCGALVPELRNGQLVVVTRALCDDGTSRALSGCEALEPVSGCSSLTESLLAAGAAAAGGSTGTRTGTEIRGVTVVTTDLFYDDGPLHRGWVEAGAQAVEMETATMFTLARLRRVKAACALLVSDQLVDGHVRIKAEELAAAELELGELAVAAYVTAS